MNTLQLTQGTVKFAAGQPRPTQYGDRINVVVTLPDGAETKLWGKPGDLTLTAMRKGQSVSLMFDGKSYKLVETASATTQPPQPDTPETAEAAFDASLRLSAKRYAKAVTLAKAIASKELGLPTENADVQATIAIKEIATSLFIEASRSTR